MNKLPVGDADISKSALSKGVRANDKLSTAVSLVISITNISLKIIDVTLGGY